MLGLFYLAQKLCLAVKLFLTYIPHLPSLPTWRYLNLKLACSLQKCFFKKPTAFFLDMRFFCWLVLSQSLFVKCTYCRVETKSFSHLAIRAS